MVILDLDAYGAVEGLEGLEAFEGFEEVEEADYVLKSMETSSAVDLLILSFCFPLVSEVLEGLFFCNSDVELSLDAALGFISETEEEDFEESFGWRLLEGSELIAMTTSKVAL
jgi:hypothetical protein